MNGEEKYDFDTVKFNGDIEERYPGVTAEVRDGLYDIRWENYSDKYQFELSMHKSRCTFAIDYFNSSDRLQDLANFIIWLRGYFPEDKEVILCNEDYSASLVLIGDVSINDIKKRLE
jgi:hypothetical protein